MITIRLNSIIKIVSLCMFCSFISDTALGQIMVNPQTKNVEETPNLTADQRSEREKAQKEFDKSQFPSMNKTGNAAKDSENYKIEKEAWILAHPELYKQMISTNAPIKVSEEEFSKMPIEKQKEISEHPEKYVLR